jgi:hypothetical protein
MAKFTKRPVIKIAVFDSQKMEWKEYGDGFRWWNGQAQKKEKDNPMAQSRVKGKRLEVEYHS